MLCLARQARVHWGGAFSSLAAAREQVHPALLDGPTSSPPALSLPLPLAPPQPFPSHSNFILCKVTDGRDARGLKDALAKEHGIMVRHYRCAEAEQQQSARMRSSP